MESTDRISASLEEVKKLDFRKLKRHLREKRGWSTKHANDVEALYRRFLALKMVYRGRLICPTDEIAAFWHAHILDTRAYERDCCALFGQYVHHYPYLGMDGRGHRAAYEKALGESRALFVEHFGIDPLASGHEASGVRVDAVPETERIGTWPTLGTTRAEAAPCHSPPGHAAL